MAELIPILMLSKLTVAFEFVHFSLLFQFNWRNTATLYSNNLNIFSLICSCSIVKTAGLVLLLLAIVTVNYYSIVNGTTSAVHRSYSHEGSPH